MRYELTDDADQLASPNHAPRSMNGSALTSMQIGAPLDSGNIVDVRDQRQGYADFERTAIRVDFNNREPALEISRKKLNRFITEGLPITRAAAWIAINDEGDGGSPKLAPVLHPDDPRHR